MNLTIEKFIEISEKYPIHYKIIPGKYAMILLNKRININPLFNEDGLSLTHEVFHHYVAAQKIDLKEKEEYFVTYLSKKFYKKYKKKINKYVKKRLNN